MGTEMNTSRRKAGQFLSLSLDYSEFCCHEKETGGARRLPVPENAMLACLCSYVVSGLLPRVDFGYLSAPQDGERVSSEESKMKLVSRTLSDASPPPLSPSKRM